MILAQPYLTFPDIRCSSCLVHLPSAECMRVGMMFLLPCPLYHQTLLLRAFDA